MWKKIADYNFCWFMLEVFVSLMYQILDFLSAHITGRRSNVSLVVKASAGSSESSTSLTVFKSVQNVVSYSSHSHPSCPSFKVTQKVWYTKLLFADFETVGSTWRPTGTFWVGICSCSSVLGGNKFGCGNFCHFQCFGMNTWLTFFGYCVPILYIVF